MSASAWQFSLDEVRTEVARVAGVAESSLPADGDLTAHGVDSLMIMQLATTWSAAGSSVGFGDLIAVPTLSSWHTKLVKTASSDQSRSSPSKQSGVEADSFPLTPLQHAYWVGRQPGQHLGGVGCHSYFELEGAKLEPAVLEAAVTRLVRRHPMLRVEFLSDGTQRIRPGDAWPGLTVHDDRSAQDGSELQRRLESRRHALSHRLLDVEAGHVFDVQLSLLPAGFSRLHLNIDMLAVDVRSIQIFFEDLARQITQPTEARREASGYRDYVLSTQRTLTDQTAGTREAWLTDRLGRLSGPPALPMREPASMSPPRFTHRRHHLGSDRRRHITGAARDHGITASLALATVLAEVLATWSSSEQMMLSLPIFKRPSGRPGVDGEIGDFTDVVLVEADVGSGDTFVRQAQRLQSDFRRAASRSDISGVEVLRELTRSRGRRIEAPVVFASMLGLGGFISAEAQSVLGHLVFRASQTPQVTLDVQVSDALDGGVDLDWYSVDDEFESGVMPAMFDAYAGRVDNLASEPADWLKPTPDLVPAPQRAIRSADLQPAWSPALLHAAILEQAVATPNRPAVTDGRTTLSYQELLGAAAATAALLRTAGAGRGDRIAVCLPKCIGQVAAVLGILLAGGSYVPIGRGQPASRRELMCSVADVTYALTDDEDSWPSSVTILPMVDTKSDGPVSNQPTELEPGDPAYVIFTSGSTGVPKGVVISHAAAWNTVAEINDRFDIGGTDRVLAVSELDFDLSVYDIFGPLSTGGCMVVVEEAFRREPGHWLRLMHGHGVTIWNSAPPLLEMALAAAAVSESPPTRPRPESSGSDFTAERASLASLRLAMVSGDWVRTDLATRLGSVAPGVRTVALGGATEAAIWSNAYEMGAPLPGWTSVPYGRPLRGQQLRVIGREARDLPDWVEGELWIGGRGVALGYADDPVQTAEKFVSSAGQRWYRTGDLGRWRPDGLIEFLGRRDLQVKIKGHRIELGEIETHLLAHPHVAEVAVVPTRNNRGLGAAVMLVADDAVPSGGLDRRLTDWLAERVPSYMIPDRYRVVPALPLGATGKIDRSAVQRLLGHDVIRPPRPTETLSDVEAEVAELWHELLGSRPTDSDDFFAMGGDSLIATKLVTRLRDRGWTGAQIVPLFRHPTLRGFAESISTLHRHEPTSPSETDLVTPSERFAPFDPTPVQSAYWVGRQGGLMLGGVGSQWYVEYAIDQPDVTVIGAAVDRIVAAHDMLRTVFGTTGQLRVLESVGAFAVTACNTVEALRDTMAYRKFDPATWPLFAVGCTAGPVGRIGFCFDNLILDAQSIELFLDQLDSLLSDPKATLPSPALTFRQYRTQLRPNPRAAEVAWRYWTDKAPTLSPPPSLPMRIDPELVENPRFVRRQALLDYDRWERLIRRARAARLTPAAVLAASYGRVLASWSGMPGVTLNVTLFDRRPVHHEVNHVMGDFTSLLLAPFRTGENWQQEARTLQEEIWTGLQHSDVSAVEVLRESSRRNGSPSWSPIVFTSGLGASGNRHARSHFRDPVWGLSHTPQVWLDHQILPQSNGIALHWDAPEELFHPEDLSAMFADYLAHIDWLCNPGSDWSTVAPPIHPDPQGTVRPHWPFIAKLITADGRELHPGIETELAELWSRQLDTPVTRSDENFFQLGGDSLAATRLIADLRQRWGTELTLRALFTHPTVADCAALLNLEEFMEEGIL